jgi:DNA repair exonuclease SbcCD ATPase subunit
MPPEATTRLSLLRPRGKRAAEKQQKDFELQKKRDAEQQAHDEKMAKIRENLDDQNQAQKDLQLARDREAALKQQEQDVEYLKERLRQKAEAEKKRQNGGAKGAAEQAAASSSSIAAAVVDTVKSAVNTLTGTPPTPSSPENAEENKKKESEAQSDWQRRKDTDGVTNPHIDAIMEMIGLEPVKRQVLRIMDKVDVNVRQDTSLAKERFNVVLLGNPGTGIILSVSQRVGCSLTIHCRKDYRGKALCQIPGFRGRPSR